jgi:ribosomal protein L34
MKNSSGMDGMFSKSCRRPISCVRYRDVGFLVRWSMKAGRASDPSRRGLSAPFCCVVLVKPDTFYFQIVLPVRRRSMNRFVVKQLLLSGYEACSWFLSESIISIKWRFAPDLMDIDKFRFHARNDQFMTKIHPVFSLQSWRLIRPNPISRFDLGNVAIPLRPTI